MSSLEDIRKVRGAKRALLSAKGANPYPASARLTATLGEAGARFDALAGKEELTLGGRVMALRGQGAILFADLFDGTGILQAVFKKDAMGGADFALFSDAADIGDFIEVSGTLFRTKTGEKSLLAVAWRMLSKSLRPLPEKWHGLADTEERFRKRYLDTLMNEGARERFVVRSRIVSALRGLLDAEGFLEVETSMLQPIPGGANAEPFATRHHALGLDLFLRIALEIDLKKLLVGGFPKVYEVGRCFRNEGIDVTHHPEFTMLEWYAAYSDAARERARVERIVRALVQESVGKEQVSFGGEEIDFATTFAVADYFELLKQHASVGAEGRLSVEALARRAQTLGVPLAEKSAVKLLDGIFKKAVRPKLIAPTFVVSFPAEMIPLAKHVEGKKDVVDAFQLYAGGIELVKAFSELNDPVEQRRRFEEQEKARAEGDHEAQPLDEFFLEALEYGCPPAGGVGIGIERLVMLFTDTRNIRDAILFPTLRPKGGA